MSEETNPVVQDIGTHYRRKKDNFWYERVIGGRDIPFSILGPGHVPSPSNRCSICEEYLLRVAEETAKEHYKKLKNLPVVSYQPQILQGKEISDFL
jgi:hypothetical protein